jgi:hypothetical protein
MNAPAGRREAGRIAFVVALPPPVPIGLVLLCRSASDTRHEIVAAYFVIDENYFPYTRALRAVKRKIYYQNNSGLWKK